VLTVEVPNLVSAVTQCASAVTVQDEELATLLKQQQRAFLAVCTLAWLVWQDTKATMDNDRLVFESYAGLLTQLFEH